jgi:hypothetical protein
MSNRQTSPLFMVFVMQLMHMERLLPQLVGDTKWDEFVQDRVTALMGMPDSESSQRFGGRLR